MVLRCSLKFRDFDRDFDRSSSTGGRRHVPGANHREDLLGDALPISEDWSHLESPKPLGQHAGAVIWSYLKFLVPDGSREAMSWDLWKWRHKCHWIWMLIGSILDPYWIHIGSIKGPFIAAVSQRIARCVALLTCSLICTTRGTSSMSCGASQSDQSSGAAWRFWNMTWDTLWETWQFAIENGHWNSEFSH